MGTIQDEGVFLSDCNSDDALSNVYETSFLSVLKTSSPPGKVAAFEDAWGILDALAKRWLMYFWVAAVDL